LANALINSALLVAGIKDEKHRRFLVRDRMYPISRALVGDEIADRSSYPESTKFRARGMLLQYRLDQWSKRFLSRVLRRSDSTIDTVLGVSFYDDAGIPFHLPDHVYSEHSSKW